MDDVGNFRLMPMISNGICGDAFVDFTIQISELGRPPRAAHTRLAIDGARGKIAEVG